MIRKDRINEMKGKDRIIVALDVPTLEKAQKLVEELYKHVGMFKVGLQLLHSEGTPRVVKTIQKAGGKVFVDAKLHDIPNTVAKASEAISSLGVEMFNVHASGGTKMMEAAVENKKDSRVLAVTVLTSLGEREVDSLYGTSVTTKVLHLAMEAILARVDGIICSSKELNVLKRETELVNFLYVTPGIRPEWAERSDQKRVTTPAEAIFNGADYLVIGRPITNPPREIGTPINAAKRIIQEIEAIENRILERGC